LLKESLKELLLYVVPIGIGVIKMELRVVKEKYKKSKDGKMNLEEVLLL
jgi:hypothetical protein